MELPCRVSFVDESLKKAYDALQQGDSREKELHAQISDAFSRIGKNAFCGIQIPKRLIPKSYRAPNLWKYNLPDAWRLLYSVESDGILVLAIVLEWLNHKEYERRFKY